MREVELLMTSPEYVGDELELFALADNWKAYLHRCIQPFFGARVLEVGAGLGATTAAFCRGQHQRWVCLEPDHGMVRHLEKLVSSGQLPPCCEALQGTLSTAEIGGPFDCILYIDVLEHIEDDAAELAQIPPLLNPGGTLIVLAPAHQWLFSPFDQRIGHYRRYTKSSLEVAAPAGLALQKLRYLDSAGLLASLANRALLRQSLPTRRQIIIWDRYLVPISRWLDVMFLGYVGKSVLGIWQRPGER